VLGSAYPHDPVHPPVWYIEWLVRKNLAPGAIVILHDGIPDPTRSIEALPAVLAEGRRRGFQFVPIGRLMDAARSRLGAYPAAASISSRYRASTTSHRYLSRTYPRPFSPSARRSDSSWRSRPSASTNSSALS